jgi:hypothetical protein
MEDSIRLDRKSAEGLLLISLNDILKVIAARGESLCWRILSLWARGDLTRLGTNMKDLEARVQGNPSGVYMSWADLNAFAETVDEIMDAVFSGYPCDSPPPQLGPGLDPHKGSVILLELVDSGFWEVSCEGDRELLGRLKILNR